VSLQGSLDTFALPDVLVLLAGTKKSGELHIAGSRVSSPGRPPEIEGRLWMDDGLLIGCDVPRASEIGDGVFELLRLVEGTFSFGNGSPVSPRRALEVETVLAEAQTRLAEWREIERVVPSLASWLELAPEPPTAHVSLRGDQWRLIAVVGGGCPVSGAVERLGLGEMPACRVVKELVESGLVRIGEPAASAEAPEPAAAPASAAAPVAVAPTEPEAGHTNVFDLVAHDDAPVLEWTTRHDHEDEAEGWSEPSTPALEAPSGRFSDLAEVVPDHGEATEPTAPATLAAVPSTPEWSGSATEAGQDGERIAEVAWSSNRETPESEAPAPEAAVPEWRTRLGDVADLDAVVSLPVRSRRPESEGSAPEDGSRHDAEAIVGGTMDGTLDGTGEDGDEPLNRGLLLKFLSSVRN